MNNVPMTAKEYLSQAYRIDQRINAKLMRISELFRISTRAHIRTYVRKDVSHVPLNPV